MTMRPANLRDLALKHRAEMARQAAVEKVYIEHAQQGLALHIEVQNPQSDGTEEKPQSLCTARL